MRSKLIFLAAVLTALAATSPVRAEVTAEKVRRSIEAAVTYLTAQRNDEGGWLEIPTRHGGVTALCTLALLNAGVPVDDPEMQKSLNYLRKIQSENVYVLAMQTMVLCYAEPEQDLLIIRRNVAALENAQMRQGARSGCWGYSKSQGPGDNSNAQFALMALHEAERAGVSTSEATWKLARDYWERTQNPDGSWGYHDGDPGTGSMTCAGIACLIMAAEKLSDGDATIEGDGVACCGARPDHTPIERGLQWFARNFSVHRHPGIGFWYLYYMYAVERVGRMTNDRLIGKHDWYREGADVLLAAQAQLRGNWVDVVDGERGGNPYIATSFALLFIAKGRRPVLAHKLSFDPEDHWERHRRDLAHLTAYCEKKWKRELTWQVVRARDATADDYNQAPVLWISGSETPKLSDAEVKELRRYVDLGGFIFAENCCNSAEFDPAFRGLIERMFPERDEQGRPLYALRPLPLEHSIWTAEEPIDPKYLRPLLGLDVGCRTSIVYCPKNLGCYWELDRTGRKQTYPPAVEDEIKAVRSIGINVLAYATNREVKFKLEIPRLAAAEAEVDAVDRAKLYIGEIKHQGGSTVAPTALANLLRQLRVETGLRVSTDKREIALTQDALFDHHLVFMHGRSSFSFTDAERKQLRLFVERGGMLLADSVCSSAEFTTSFRREMKAIFPETPLEPLAADHPLFGEKFGGFDLSTVTLRDPRRAAGGGPLQTETQQVPPELEAVRIGTRLGVVFSRYDLSCALEKQNTLECVGYGRDDAAKLGINVILFSLRGNL